MKRETDLVHHVRRMALLPGDGIPLDRELLGAFVTHRDEAAFEALVMRHGSMVLSVCQRVLQNHHDAEDAFQAAFLVLARKAASVKPRHLLGNWLYGVAYRTALEARTVRRKRLARQRSLTDVPEAARPARICSLPFTRSWIDCPTITGRSSFFAILRVRRRKKRPANSLAHRGPWPAG